MKRMELLQIHESLSNAARKLMAAKSHDYAGDTDALKNFRHFGRWGVIVRLMDKLSRLESFEEQATLEVKDESIQDTVQDICNYAIIYYALYSEEQRKEALDKMTHGGQKLNLYDDPTVAP